jgi:hypothetical protein
MLPAACATTARYYMGKIAYRKVAGAEVSFRRYPTTSCCYLRCALTTLSGSYPRIQHTSPSLEDAWGASSNAKEERVSKFLSKFHQHKAWTVVSIREFCTINVWGENGTDLANRWLYLQFNALRILHGLLAPHLQLPHAPVPTSIDTLRIKSVAAKLNRLERQRHTRNRTCGPTTSGSGVTRRIDRRCGPDSPGRPDQ